MTLVFNGRSTNLIDTGFRLVKVVFRIGMLSFKKGEKSSPPLLVLVNNRQSEALQTESPHNLDTELSDRFFQYSYRIEAA